MRYFNNIFLLFFVFSSYSYTKEIDYIKKATNLKLHKDDYWLKLLHYENNSSTILENEFFLSKNGKTDPKNELVETINSFLKDKKYICRYPARFKWLKSKLDFNIESNLKECIELNNYLDPNKVDTLSIVFTSERYSSPSSVFGHTFLQVQTQTIKYAINYAANVPDNQNQILYAYRGITGKYKSQYKLMPYYIKDYEYRDEEFRDLITYKLDLSKDEIKNIIYHLFEIRNTTNNYYFFSRNCSSELVKLLDISKYNIDLSSNLSNSTIPIEIIYLLKKNNMINDIYSEDSKMKQFVNLITNMDSNEKSILSNLINSSISTNSFYRNSNLNSESKNKIILAAIKYFEIKSSSGSIRNKSLNTFMKLILIKDKNKIDDIKNKHKLKNNPISNKFHKFSIGYKGNKNYKHNLFGYRHLYRNRFDLEDMYLKNGSVEVFDLNIYKYNNKIKLESFNLFNIEALPISNIYFFQSTTQVSFGSKKTFFSNNQHIFYDYKKGIKYQLLENLFNHTYGDIGLYYYDSLLLKGSIINESEYVISNNNIFLLSIKYEKYENGYENRNLSFKNFYKISQNITSNLIISKNSTYKSDDHIAISLNINF